MAIFGIIQTTTIVKNQAFDDLISVEKLIEDYGVENISRNFSAIDDSQSIRVSWIDANGVVLYDSAKDFELFDNHLDRPEIIEALVNGSGQAIRNSKSLDMDTYYYAKIMDDNSFIRISKDYNDISSIIKNTVYFMLVLSALLIVMSYLFAKKISLMLIKPVKELSENIEEIENNEKIYEEIKPFVKTIKEQHLDILKASEMRKEFTANVTHELKTPLTVIAGYSELMSTGMADINDTKFLATEIYHNSQKLQSLIDDILNLSNLDQKDIKFENQNINLELICKNVITNLEVVANKKGIKIIYDGSPVFMNANSKLMDELITNLVYNAINYNKNNGSVVVNLNKIDNSIILEVIDTGIGISNKDQNRIFERFYRVDKSRSKEMGGTGLGLAIVKHIVGKYDGEIEVNSEINKGTTFRIIF
jgi:two-component system phosphate regulon sensor histidine kinase PhoR